MIRNRLLTNFIGKYKKKETNFQVNRLSLRKTNSER